MVCVRSRWLAAGLLICSVVLGACGSKKEGDKSAEGKSGTSAAGNQDLDVIPLQSDLVLGIDLAQAQKSGAYREYVLPMMTRSAEVQKVTELLKTKCQLDPMAVATRLTAGVKLANKRNLDGVVVVHGIEKAKALPCLDQVKEQLAAEHVEVTKDGDVVMLKGERGELAFTFTGDSTVLVVMGGKANKEGVMEAAQAKSALKSSKEFADMYSRIQTGHTIWYLVRGDADVLANLLKQVNVQAKALFGSVNLTDGLELYGQLRAESEEQATNVVDLVKAQGGMVGGMAEKFEVDRDKADVRTTVVLNQAQLKTVSGLLRSLVRGFR